MWLKPRNLVGPIIRENKDHLFFQGTLADRPAAEDVALNFTYLTVDEGIVYCNLEDGWHQAGYDMALNAAMSNGHAFVVDMKAGATETYPGE